MRLDTGCISYSAAETLGCAREDLYQKMLDGQMKYSSIFNFTRPSAGRISA